MIDTQQLQAKIVIPALKGFHLIVLLNSNITTFLMIVSLFAYRKMPIANTEGLSCLHYFAMVLY